MVGDYEAQAVQQLAAIVDASDDALVWAGGSHLHVEPRSRHNDCGQRNVVVCSLTHRRTHAGCEIPLGRDLRDVFMTDQPPLLSGRGTAPGHRVPWSGHDVAAPAGL